MKNNKIISLREIEGPGSPHQVQLDNALSARGETFARISDVPGLAGYVGGEVEPLGLGEDWSIRKELLPGVSVHFVYYHADDELPGTIKVLYSGDRVKQISADVLTAISMAYIGYMANYKE